jgi:hypothetical protein
MLHFATIKVVKLVKSVCETSQLDNGLAYGLSMRALIRGAFPDIAEAISICPRE